MICHFNDQQIYDNCKLICDELDTKVTMDDPHIVAEQLLKITNLLGLSSMCCACAELLYQKDKRKPEYQMLRVFSNETNKNLHYQITSYQSILGLLKLEKSKF